MPGTAIAPGASEARGRSVTVPVGSVAMRRWQRPGSAVSEDFLAALDAAAERHPLVLVSAPSGYGRSAAVAEWARRRRGAVWLQAEATGLDTEQVEHAVATLARSAGVSVEPDPLDAGPPRREGLLAAALAATGRPLLLILDEAHLLDQREIDRVLCADAVLGSGKLCVVLVGAPRLLREHSRQLVKGVAGLVDHRFLLGAAADLDAWPLPDRSRAGELSDRMLRRLSRRQWSFVLDAALIPFVDGDILDQVLAPGLWPLLDECVDAGLPLSPARCGDGRVRAHWAPGFAAVCRVEAFAADPARARWVESRAVAALTGLDPVVAARLAAESGDGRLAARILADAWLRLLVSGAEAELEAACQALPGGWAQSPEIVRITAACRTVSDGSAARPVAAGAHEPDFTRLADLILVEDRRELETVVRRVAPLAQGIQDSSTRLHATYLVGWAQTSLRSGAARDTGLLAAIAHEADNLGETRLSALARLAQAEDDVARGRFRAAERGIAAAEAELGPRPGSWAAARLRKATLARGYAGYWQGEPERVFDAAAAVLEDPRADEADRGRAQLLAGHAVADSGRWDLLPSGWDLLGSSSEPGATAARLHSDRELLAAKLCLVEGDPDGAARRAHAVGLASTSATVLARSAQVLRVAGRSELALETAARALARPAASHERALVLVVAALLDIDEGRLAVANRRLEAALGLAVVESVWGPFLIPDRTLEAALDGLALSGSQHEAALSEIFARRSKTEDSGLTPREREVLGYLHTALTLGEISAQLRVAPSTVKTHSRAIYRKLGVRDRKELLRTGGR